MGPFIVKHLEHVQVICNINNQNPLKANSKNDNIK